MKLGNYQLDDEITYTWRKKVWQIEKVAFKLDKNSAYLVFESTKRSQT